jgi:hypothetical protein
LLAQNGQLRLSGLYSLQSVQANVLKWNFSQVSALKTPVLTMTTTYIRDVPQ